MQRFDLPLTCVIEADQSFRRLPPNAVREDEYEALLFQDRAILFPDLYFASFKTDVTDGRRVKRPDFALIDYSYRGWWVVEAEISAHPWSHVEEQVEVFSNARFGKSHADALLNANNEMEEERLVDLVTHVPPRVAVIAHGRHEQTEGWIEGLALFDVDFAHVDVCRSHLNQHALVVSGVMPSAATLDSTDISLACGRALISPKWIRVDEPAMLGASSGESIEILINGDDYAWVRKDFAGEVMLCPAAGDPLLESEIGNFFRLMPKGDKRFLLEEE